MQTLFFIFLLLASQLAWGEPASSDGLNFTATLDSIKIQGRPGLTVNRNFLLTLGQDEKRVHFKSSVSDFWRSEDGHQSFYAAPGTITRSCAPWITLNPVEQAVDPGQTMTVRLSVGIPGEVQPGGYWCTLNVDQLSDPLEQSEGVQIKFLASISVGVFVYIDPLERRARVTDVRMAGDEAAVTLENEGNTPLGVEGRLEFLRADSQTPIVVKIPRHTIFTEPVRKATMTVKLPDTDTLPAGEYTVRAILDIGLEHYIGVQRKIALQR